MTDAIEDSQRKAATVVGFSYLFALVPAIFAEFYVRGQLIVSGEATQTAHNILAHERLFRLGIARGRLGSGRDSNADRYHTAHGAAYNVGLILGGLRSRCSAICGSSPDLCRGRSQRSGSSPLF